MSTEPETGTVAPAPLPALQRETILPSSDRGRLAAIVATCSLAGLAGGMALSMLAETHRMMEQTRELRVHASGPITWLGVKGLRDKHHGRCEGVVVGDVVAGSPASRAGFASRDVIVGFDGAPICDGDGLVRAVRGSALGATPTLTVKRGATDVVLQPRLAAMPESIRRQLR